MRVAVVWHCERKRERREYMLRIKRVPTIVSNYQKEEVDQAPRPVGGRERNCLVDCCIQGEPN